MQYIQMYPLFELSAEVKAELFPILLFFGMFFCCVWFWRDADPPSAPQARLHAG